MIAGVVSDTHGLIRGELLQYLQGVDIIIHAGDIGTVEELRVLNAIAPVSAVRGNTDVSFWAEDLSFTQVVQFGSHLIYVLHNLDDLDLDPVAANISAVVYGHTHKAKTEIKNGVLYYNPGSAGPRRFNYPVSAGKIEILENRLVAKTQNLI